MAPETKFPQSFDPSAIILVTMDRQLVDDLRDDLASGTSLLIVGTGVSIQATGGQRCATWDGLIRDGIEYCLSAKLLSKDQGQLLLANLATEDVSELLEIAQVVSSALGAPHGG